MARVSGPENEDSGEAMSRVDGDFRVLVALVVMVVKKISHEVCKAIF